MSDSTTKARINDGGPAFARGGCDWTEDHGDGSFAQDGMSLRDYFAAKALQGFIGNSDLVDLMKHGFAPIKAAEVAYLCADEMLKARSR